MAKLIENVMKNGKKERLIFLLGLPGIGKSNLTINALHYMKERKFFTGGIILI